MLSNIFIDQDPETGAIEAVTSTLAEPFSSIAAIAGRPTPSTHTLRLEDTKNARNGRFLESGSFCLDQSSDDNTLVQQVETFLHETRAEIARWRVILAVPYQEFLLTR
jgi:hypothetical protein